jgi:hypothetical protein
VSRRLITSAKGEALLSFKLSTLLISFKNPAFNLAYFSEDNFPAKADQQASESLVAVSNTSFLISADIFTMTYFSATAFSFSSLTSTTSA